MTGKTERDGLKLLPCPFCGGEPSMTSGGPGNHYVRCMVCHVTSDDTFRDDAAKLWNRRSDSTLLALVQEMGKALEPFAKSDMYSEHADEDSLVFTTTTAVGDFTHGDFRDAHTALASFTAFMEGQDNG